MGRSDEEILADVAKAKTIKEVLAATNDGAEDFLNSAANIRAMPDQKLRVLEQEMAAEMKENPELGAVARKMAELAPRGGIGMSIEEKVVTGFSIRAAKIASRNTPER